MLDVMQQLVRHQRVQQRKKQLLALMPSDLPRSSSAMKRRQLFAEIVRVNHEVELNLKQLAEQKMLLSFWLETCSEAENWQTLTSMKLATQK